MSLDSAVFVSPLGRYDDDSVAECSRPATRGGVSYMDGAGGDIIADEPGVGVYETETGSKNKEKSNGVDGPVRPPLESFVTAKEF